MIDRGNGPGEITGFVLAVVTLICGGFGVVSGVGASLIVRSLRRARSWC